jgi:hypothetical protein
MVRQNPRIHKFIYLFSGQLKQPKKKFYRADSRVGFSISTDISLDDFVSIVRVDRNDGDRVFLWNFDAFEQLIPAVNPKGFIKVFP